MKAKLKVSILLAGAALASSSSSAQVRVDKWNVREVHVSASSGTWGGKLHAVLSSTSDPHINRVIDSDVVSNAISGKFVSGNVLVILGEAGRAQAVEIFDIPTGRKRDWFFCYAPKQISKSLIASVEYYPSVAAGEPTDVVLLYDTERSPSENRLIPARRIPPIRTDNPVRVGIPVFPETNVIQQSYENHVDTSQNAYSVVGSFFKLLSGNRLVFQAVRFGLRGERSTLISIVDLAPGLSHVSIKMLPIPAPNNKPVNVIDVREISPLRLQLVLDQSRSDDKTSIIDIPK